MVEQAMNDIYFEQDLDEDAIQEDTQLSCADDTLTILFDPIPFPPPQSSAAGTITTPPHSRPCSSKTTFTSPTAAIPVAVPLAQLSGRPPFPNPTPAMPPPSLPASDSALLQRLQHLTLRNSNGPTGACSSPIRIRGRVGSHGHPHVAAAAAAAAANFPTNFADVRGSLPHNLGTLDGGVSKWRSTNPMAVAMKGRGGLGLKRSTPDLLSSTAYHFAEDGEVAGFVPPHILTGRQSQNALNASMELGLRGREAFGLRKKVMRAIGFLEDEAPAPAAAGPTAPYPLHVHPGLHPGGAHFFTGTGLAPSARPHALRPPATPPSEISPTALGADGERRFVAAALSAALEVSPPAHRPADPPSRGEEGNRNNEFPLGWLQGGSPTPSPPPGTRQHPGFFF